MSRMASKLSQSELPNFLGSGSRPRTTISSKVMAWIDRILLLCSVCCKKSPNLTGLTGPASLKPGAWLRMTWQGDEIRNRCRSDVNSETCPSCSGWWLTYPSEKSWSSSVGDDDIPNIWENKIHVPNHQPVYNHHIPIVVGL